MTTNPTGPGRPAIGSPTLVRLPDSLVTAADAHAHAHGISRAELIRRAVERYLHPHAAATDDARAWETLGGWVGEFEYSTPGDEPVSVQDWSVYVERPTTGEEHTPITVVMRSEEISIESAAALGLSVLAAVAHASRPEHPMDATS